MPNQWFRLYAEFAFDPKVQVLTEALQRRYVMALCLQCNGMFENRPDDEVALALRITPEEWQSTKNEFQKRGLVTADGKINGWEKRQYISDVKDSTAAERQRRYREKKAVTRNSPVTSRPPEQKQTQIQNREEEVNKCSPRVRATSPRQKAMPKETAHLEASFEVFWLGYPRREGKGKARAAYISALQQGVKHEDIIAGLERFAAAKPWGSPEYIPHPASWLNAERWKDDFTSAGHGSLAAGSADGPRRNGGTGGGRPGAQSYFEITEDLIAETRKQEPLQ